MSDEQPQFKGDAEDRVSRFQRERDEAREQLAEAREWAEEVAGTVRVWFTVLGSDVRCQTEFTELVLRKPPVAETREALQSLSDKLTANPEEPDE